MPKAQLATVVRHLHDLASPPDVGELSDAQLLRRFADRHDQAAFAAVVLAAGVFAAVAFAGLLAAFRGAFFGPAFFSRRYGPMSGSSSTGQSARVSTYS